MAIGEGKVRIQAVVDEELSNKISVLADRMGLSQSKMIDLLLDAAVKDNAWIIKAVTSKFANKVHSAFTGGRQRRKTSKDESED